MSKQLELTDEMLMRIDDIDNAVQDCIVILAEEEIIWDIEIIGAVRNAIVEVLADRDIPVRIPSIITDENGDQHYSDE